MGKAVRINLRISLTKSLKDFIIFTRNGRMLLPHSWNCTLYSSLPQPKKLISSSLKKALIIYSTCGSVMASASPYQPRSGGGFKRVQQVDTRRYPTNRERKLRARRARVERELSACRARAVRALRRSYQVAGEGVYNPHLTKRSAHSDGEHHRASVVLSALLRSTRFRLHT